MAASARPVNRSALWTGGRDTVDPVGRQSPPLGDGDDLSAVEPAGPPPVRGTLFARFMQRYGWRAYAMPLLAALTVLTIVEITHTTSAAVGAAAGLPAVGTQSAATAASVADSLQSQADGANVLPAPIEPVVTASAVASASTGDAATGESESSSSPEAPPTAAEGLSPALAVGALPDGEPFAATGEGTYRIVPGAGARIGTAATVVTYSVEIENGMEPAGGDAAFAAFVDSTLADPRSWTGVKDVSLQRLDAADAKPDFRITLGSQGTVRGLCGYAVQLESSCYTRAEGRVMINDARWVRGALSYAGDLTSYREYAVNHEVGHALGYGHEPCPVNGGPAPVMMQQSWSTSNDQLAAINGSVTADGNTCVANPWPNPTAAGGTAPAAVTAQSAPPTG